MRQQRNKQPIISTDKVRNIITWAIDQQILEFLLNDDRFSDVTTNSEYRDNSYNDYSKWIGFKYRVPECKYLMHVRCRELSGNYYIALYLCLSCEQSPYYHRQVDLYKEEDVVDTMNFLINEAIADQQWQQFVVYDD